MIRTIPLNKLVASPRNVRRAVDEQADLQLKADIEARGLLQNLVVAPVTKPRGCFAVEAGGRRLRALQRLADEGRLDKAQEVSCLLIDSSGAQEASLAENFQRLSMNPADECLAFRQLIEHGADAESIARRFGLTVRFVEGRLRLADLADVVFQALGAGEISLDIAKAYAATPDRERQAVVFEQMSRGYGGANPDSIRRMMTQVTVSASDRRARFVGEEAYVAAGGRIERDLFSDRDNGRWLDIAILERLASEKMEAAAAAAKAEHNLAFVRPTLDSWVDQSLVEGLRRVPVSRRALTDSQVERIDALEAEVEEIAASLEHPDGGDDAAEMRLQELGAELDTIRNQPPVIDAEVQGKIGAFLVLDEQGRPKLDSNLYAEAAADPARVDMQDEEIGSALESNKSRSGVLSQRLIDELAMQRRDILAVHVAADPGLALDLAIFLMADRDQTFGRDKSGSSLAATPPSNPVFDFKAPDAAAAVAMAQAQDALDRSWQVGSSRSKRFDAFRSLSEEARAAWLGHAVASTLEASLRCAGRACAFHDHLGQLIGIDVATWWRPTGANFFDRVPKSVAMDALAEIGGAALADRYAKAKKAELAQACERIFSGDFIADVEVKAAALAWVPAVMRFGTDNAVSELAVEDPAPSSEAGGENVALPSHQVEEAA